MGEITDYVLLYVENSDILEKATTLISADFQKNMRSNLWKGHGYDKGELYKDIYTNEEVNKDYSIITGGYTVEHGQYVISGVRGKGMAKSGPIDFLGDGLQKTLEMYK